jgi:hypothetical protein
MIIIIIIIIIILLLYRVRHKSVNTPLSHERLVVRTWLAVYSGWGYEMRDIGATAAILKAVILDPTLEF